MLGNVAPIAVLLLTFVGCGYQGLPGGQTLPKHAVEEQTQSTLLWNATSSFLRPYPKKTETGS